MPYAPLREAKLSVGSATVLSKLPGFIEDQLPRGARLVKDTGADYAIEIRIQARNKRGPAYPDFESGNADLLPGVAAAR